MSGICEHEEITIHDMDLPYEVLFGICKVIFVKGVVPLYRPLNLIKTFEEFCEICIFPFFAFINDSTSHSESEREFDQMMDHSISEFAAEHHEHHDLGPNEWGIELWGLAPGLLEQDLCISFLGQQCNLTVIYLQGFSFRLAITSLEEIKTNSINLELEYDSESFAKKFDFYDHRTFKQGEKTIGTQPREIVIPQLKKIGMSFVDEIRDGLSEFEARLKDEFGSDVTFNFLVYERTGLIYQLRLADDLELGTQMELWCVKDCPNEQELKFTCTTLYNVKIRKNYECSLDRSHTLAYSNIWAHFGVSKVDLSKAELLLISYLYLKTLYLFMPTISLNKGDEEDSDHEEKAWVAAKPLENVAYSRRVLQVGGRMVPATVSLVGYGEKYYLGIKVTLFDPEKVKESGFFLTVD